MEVDLTPKGQYSPKIDHFDQTIMNSLTNTFKLSSGIILPNDVIIKIWNYIINSNFDEIESYYGIISYSHVSKLMFEKVYPIIDLKMANLMFDKFVSNYDPFRDYCYKMFNCLLRYTQCIMKYKNGNSREIKLIIKNKKIIANETLKQCEKSISYWSDDGGDRQIIEERNFIYLSNIYDYEYETSQMWRLKGCMCFTCYISAIVACCPLICVSCPCICWYKINYCTGSVGTCFGLCKPLSALNIDKKKFHTSFNVWSFMPH